MELAAGNPLFVSELLRGYGSAGALADVGPDTIEARFELDLQATGLDEVIRAHLGQLDAPTRDVLAAMAVWGTDIGVDDLAGMLPGSAAVLDELLERAVSSGLVRRDPAGTVGFSHNPFREVTYRELAESQRRTTHRRAAEVFKAAGYRPSLVADHLLRAAGDDADTALVAALHETVAAIREYAPEVTAELLDDVAAVGADVPARLLLEHADALFHQGRGESAETLIRERMATVADPVVAAGLQLILIRSLMNRAESAAALAVIGRTVVLAGVPGARVRQLEATRAWLLILAGQGLPAAELDAMMARYAAAGDTAAQAGLLACVVFTAFLAGHPEAALDHMRAREALLPGADSFRSRSSSLTLPSVFELAAWAADLALDAARVALAGMNRQLARQLGQDVPALCPPEVSLLVRGMLAADPDMIGEAADDLAGAGRRAAEAFAREELACAAAVTGNRDRALARMRALGIRRSSREPHRDAGHGWAALTATEVRIAALVREGLTNREIGARLFVSPRTVQTHVSHILQKTDLRSRVEIARFAGA